VSGRSEIPFEQQVRLDLRYIRAQSLYQASLKLLRAGFPGLCLAAEGADEALVMEGRAWVNASAKVVGRAYVGTGSRIGEGAVLAGDCVACVNGKSLFFYDPFGDNDHESLDEFSCQ
jgi:hypothetical protein